MQKYLLLFIFLAFTTTSFPKKASRLSFSGKVVDKQDNSPIIGAKVFIHELNQTIYTDFDGNFTFKKVSTHPFHTFSRV